MKVVIDSFDTEEQAVAFLQWLRTRLDAGVPKLITTQGQFSIEDDGVDHSTLEQNILTLNIAIYQSDEDEEYGPS